MSSVVADKTGVGPSSAGEHALRRCAHRTGQAAGLAWPAAVARRATAGRSSERGDAFGAAAGA
jgi:hypothetical protein